MADSMLSSATQSSISAPAVGGSSHVAFIPAYSAINEKAMAGQPAEELAFLLHSLYGMDHYPSYLLKWQPEQLHRLRQALLLQVAHVDAAVAAVSFRQQRLLSYAPLVPCLTRQDVLSWINPQVLQAMQLPPDRMLPLLLRVAVDELGDGTVWTFDLLSRDGEV
jgi:hypothetical protein